MSSTNKYTINAVTLDKLVANLDRQSTDSISYSQLLELLDHVHKYKLRRSDIVTKYGVVLLERFKSRLGTARAAVLREQILLAALDMHNEGLMEEMDEELTAAFGGSNRRMRLHAMRKEAMAFHDSADSSSAEMIYDGMVTENPSNVLARKRQIAQMRDSGNEPKAIQMLIEFLSTFQNDLAGWQELGELYAARNSLEEAKFCYEEVMTISPNHPAQPFHVCRYAELLYSLGDGKNIEQVEQARCYFALSCQMQLKGNLRALYGLLASSKCVLDCSKATSYHTEAQASLKHAKEEIQNYYEAANVASKVQQCVDYTLAAYTDNWL